MDKSTNLALQVFSSGASCKRMELLSFEISIKGPADITPAVELSSLRLFD
jgi:hypothetical protein